MKFGSGSISEGKEHQGSAAVFYDESKDISIFTAKEIKSGLEGAGYHVAAASYKGLTADKSQYRIILTTRDSIHNESFSSKVIGGEELSADPQGYSIRKTINGEAVEWYIIGADDSGILYGGLDFMEAILKKGLDKVEDMDGKPYIPHRGIKFNIPLDARTPSYSDSGDSAQKNITNMWDMEFWTEFLDEMARRRFNVLSLWSLHPFPSLVKVPAYPNVALSDVMQTTTPLNNELEGRRMSTSESLQNLRTLKVMPMEEKIRFWKDVMQYAENRGIGIYIFTWNTFIYGTEGSGYDFTVSVADLKTQDYFRKSVEALINTYPLLKGIGITAGENMSRNADMDEAWLYNTYGLGINDALEAEPKRSFRLIHRIQYANIRKAINAFSGLNPRCTLETSFKYCQAHMYSSTRPSYIHANDDSYLKDIGNHKTWLTVRDDDYYMFRGGCDTEFARAFIKSMPYEKLQGFYMGPDGYTWGREYISTEPHRQNQLVTQKRWFSFMLWGKMSYNPNAPAEDFESVLDTAFPGANSHHLLKAWSMASRIIPLVNRLHNKGCQLDFQWYPEACTSNTGFHDINRFIDSSPQDQEGIVSMRDYADAVVNDCDPQGITPVDIAKQIWENAVGAEELIRDMHVENNTELWQIISDMDALAVLGKYYAKKMLGATYKCIADTASAAQTKQEYQSRARESLQEASGYWADYVKKVEKLYKPQTLTRLIQQTPGVPRYVDVAALQKDVDRDIMLV